MVRRLAKVQLVKLEFPFSQLSEGQLIARLMGFSPVPPIFPHVSGGRKDDPKTLLIESIDDPTSLRERLGVFIIASCLGADGSINVETDGFFRVFRVQVATLRQIVRPIGGGQPRSPIGFPCRW